MPRREINCQAIYTFNQIAGDAAVGLASINLSIRTWALYPGVTYANTSPWISPNRMAIWSQNRYIIGFLILVILGHWSLILQGIAKSLFPYSPVDWYKTFQASSWRPSGFLEQDVLSLKLTTRFLLPFSSIPCASTLLFSHWTRTNSLLLGEKGKECSAPVGLLNSSSLMAWFTSSLREFPFNFFFMFFCRGAYTTDTDLLWIYWQRFSCRSTWTK